MWSILGWGEISLSWKLGKKMSTKWDNCMQKRIRFYFRYIPLIFKISYTRLLHWWQVLKQFSRSQGANWLKISDKISLGRISLMLSPILASWVKTSEEMVRRAKGKGQIFISTYVLNFQTSRVNELKVVLTVKRKVVATHSLLDKKRWPTSSWHFGYRSARCEDSELSGF